MRQYFLRYATEGVPSNLYVEVHSRKAKIRMLLNTQVAIESEKWNDPRFAQTKKGRAILAQLARVDEAITNALKAVDCSVASIRKAAFEAAFPDEAIKMRRLEEEERRAKEEEEARLVAARAKREADKAERKRREEERKKNVPAYLDKFISDIKTGARKHGGDNYQPNTVKMWKTFAGVLGKYYEGHPFTWMDVNKALVADFTRWMETEGYMTTSINKYIICFRALVGYSLEEGYHTNSKLEKVFSKKKVRDDLKAREIYLTAEELQALYEMPLTGTQEVYRDVFLIGCYTCQRFSDYSRIEAGSIYTTERGTRIIELTQQKTGNKVFVPILTENLETLLAKYDYTVPTISDVVLNRYIKEILKQLAQTVPSLAVTERTVLTMKERVKQERGEAQYTTDAQGYTIKPRYELVTTHTARRTGITLLYKSRLFDIPQMMHVSGHKDPKIFLEYIKLSGKEIADEISSKAKNSNINPF